MEHFEKLLEYFKKNKEKLILHTMKEESCSREMAERYFNICYAASKHGIDEFKKTLTEENTFPPFNSE